MAPPRTKRPPRVKDLHAEAARDAAREAAAKERRAKRKANRDLRARQQAGDLVLWAGLDGLTNHEMAGAFLELARKMDSPAQREAWRRAGAGVFQRQPDPAAGGGEGGTAGEAEPAAA